MNGLFLGIRILIWIVGTGTLLAGVIGVSNIMLIIIKERTREIGIQRAIGATPWRVISQVITESVTLTTIAGSFGLVLGVFLLEMINKLLMSSGGDSEAFKNPEVDIQVAVIALIVLILAGIVAGLIPARKAVSMKPVDALRYE
jgi:putative ABC transport system permease protein